MGSQRADFHLGGFVLHTNVTVKSRLPKWSTHIFKVNLKLVALSCAAGEETCCPGGRELFPSFSLVSSRRVIDQPNRMFVIFNRAY